MTRIALLLGVLAGGAYVAILVLAVREGIRLKTWGDSVLTGIVAAVLVFGAFMGAVALATFVVGSMGLGDAPLHLAARQGDVTTTRRLVEGGASVSVHDLSGRTPLELAISAKAPSSRAVVEYLITKGAAVGPDEMDAAARRNDLGLLKYLVARGGRIERYHLADYIGANTNSWNPQYLDFLLSAGADMDAYESEPGHKRDGYTADGVAYTALARAIKAGDLRLVEYLVEKGADVNRSLSDGKTPRQLAETPYRIGDTTGPGVHFITTVQPPAEVARFLREHGAR